MARQRRHSKTHPDWAATVDTAIKRADCLIFVLSPDSAASVQCARELQVAVGFEKRIQPVLRRAVDDDAVARLPGLAKPNWFRADADHDVARLAGELGEALAIDHDYVAEHTRLYLLAEEWQRRGGTGLLLAGADLEQSERWLAGSEGLSPAATGLHRTHIEASRSLENINRARALVARGEELLAELPAKLPVALLLATEAQRLSPSEQATPLLGRESLVPRLIRRLREGEPGTERPIALSEDGTTLVWAEGTRLVVQRTEDESVPCASFENDDLPDLVWISATGRFVAACAHGGTYDPSDVTVWSAADQRRIATIRLPARCMTLAFDPHDHFLALGACHEDAVVVDLSSGERWNLRHRTIVVSALAFSPDGRFLAAGQAGGTYDRKRRSWSMELDQHQLWVWDLGSMRLHHRVPVGDELDLLAFGGAAGDFLIGASGRRIHVWTAGRNLWRLRFQPVWERYWAGVVSIAIDSWDRWAFYAATKDGEMRSLQLSTRKQLTTVTEGLHLERLGGLTLVTCPHAPGPNDDSGWRHREFLSLTASHDGTVREWRDGAELTRACHDEPIVTARYTPNGRHFVCCTVSGAVFVWESQGYRRRPMGEKVVAPSATECVARLRERLARNLTQAEWDRYLPRMARGRAFEDLD